MLPAKGFRPRAAAAGCRPSRHASEQKRTRSQSRAHFFRHAKDRPQATQVFSGKCGLRCAIVAAAGSYRPNLISPATRPRRGSTSTTRSPSGRATHTPSVPPSAAAMPAMRDPSGWCNENSSRAEPPPPATPPARWTTTATSATVPATISTPIPITKALSARTDDPPPPPDAAGGTFTATAGPEAAGQRADRFLAERIGSLSRSRVKALIAEGRATRDGESLRSASEPVRAGSRYALSVPPAAPALPLPQDIPLAVLFEDADLIVLNKPAGLVVHPAPGNQEGTLVNALLAHAGEDLPGIGGERRPGIVHRLDKDTSGVMVVAKMERAHRALSLAFAERDLDREYLALAWGLPEPPAGEIEAPIGRHPADRKRMAVLSGADAERRGKPALTRYRTERAWGGAACALLRCRLLTGRTHQIRVHLAHAGHPLVGDPVYLRRVPAAARLLPEPQRGALLSFPRQALHAATLGFRHPVTGRALHFSAPPPPDLAALLASLDRNPE